MTADRDEGAGISPALGALWLDEEGPMRRQRAGLSRSAIVAAAIEIADQDGIEMVSMARIAKQLGYATMALYRHVPNKGELLTLMEDAAIGSPPPAIAERSAEGWRAGLECWAKEVVSVYRRRPWLFGIPIQGPPATPNNIRWMEAGLGTIAGTGLSPADRFAVFFLVTSFVRGIQKFFAEIMPGDPVEAAGMIPYGELLTGLMPRGQFPQVRALIDAGVLDAGDGDETAEFDFALQRVLDGIEVFIDTAVKDKRATSPGRT